MLRASQIHADIVEIAQSKIQNEKHNETRKGPRSYEYFRFTHALGALLRKIDVGQLSVHDGTVGAIRRIPNTFRLRAALFRHGCLRTFGRLYGRLTRTRPVFAAPGKVDNFSQYPPYADDRHNDHEHRPPGAVCSRHIPEETENGRNGDNTKDCAKLSVRKREHGVPETPARVLARPRLY